jgi:hypothetical protein
VLSVLALAGFVATQLAIPAGAATAPLKDAREIAHFDVTAQQQPENIALEPGGAADVTFNRARQVARVAPDGSVTVLATLPAPAAGPASVAGIVRGADGSLYVNYNAGAHSGIWRIAPDGGTPTQVLALPDVKALNGLAFDRGENALYATDSGSGTVWKVSLTTRTAALWAQGAAFESVNGTGISANGVKVHNGAVWVSNTDQGTLLRVAIGAHGAAGAVTTVARGITSIDDFAFVGAGDTVLAAQNYVSQVSIIRPDGTDHTVLTATDGLSNPTSIAVRGSTAYVASGAYFTRVDPNLLAVKVN